jgi:hypothetical protein
MFVAAWPPLNLRKLFRQNIVVIAAYTPLVDWTPPQFFVASQVCTAPREMDWLAAS